MALAGMKLLPTNQGCFAYQSFAFCWDQRVSCCWAPPINAGIRNKSAINLFTKNPSSVAGETGYSRGAAGLPGMPDRDWIVTNSRAALHGSLRPYPALNTGLDYWVWLPSL